MGFGKLINAVNAVNTLESVRNGELDSKQQALKKNERDAKKSKTACIVAIVVLIISALGFGLTSLTVVNIGNLMTKRYDNSNPIKAEIVEIEEYKNSASDDEYSYRVYVDYEYDGESHEHVKLGSYSSNMYEGKEVKIVLNPDNCEDIQLQGTGKILKIVALVFGLIPVVELFIIIIIVICMINSQKKYKEKRAIIESRDESANSLNGNGEKDLWEGEYMDASSYYGEKGNQEEYHFGDYSFDNSEDK